MDHEASTTFLSSLLGKTLQIRVSDGRLFVGQLKCTDKDMNIILGNAQEYREPSEAAVRAAAEEASKSGQPGATVRLDMTNRFLGLIVVPGNEVVKIALEEFDPTS